MKGKVMAIIKHKDYKHEVNNLKYTIDYMSEVIETTEANMLTYKDNIKEAFVNLDYLDSSNSYIEIIMNTNYMEVAMKNHNSYKKSIKKPYFSRIDIKFQDESSGEIHTFYIGKTSLLRKEDKHPLILDWRSPLASVYYDGRLGNVTYETVIGEQSVDLLLKRQFTIDNQELIHFIDVDITTNDSFLQASLEATADDKLKDIASTIQLEQNNIIRAELAKPLIVQGVAGSGKTTIALHRLAYLIYTYEETFDPDNFIVIAPNKMFVSYISNVLPELGVEEVKQTTFVDLMTELIGTVYKQESLVMNMKRFIQKQKDDDEALLRWLLSYKGSIECKEMIDRYLEDIEKSFIPNIDFCLQEHVIMTSEEIEQIFLKDLFFLPFHKRIDEIQKNLKLKIKNSKDKILKSVEAQYDKKLEYLRSSVENSEERQLKLVNLMDERDEKLKSLKRDVTTVVKKYIKQLPQKKLFEYYSDLFAEEKKILHYGRLSDQKALYLTQHTKQKISHKVLDLEDYTALVYLRYALFGFDQKLNIKNVVIDEAQDYSTFQLITLKKIFNTNMFTLLGDLSQGIYAYRGIRSWDKMIKEVFPDTTCNYMTLVQSYRTTIEIMNLANKVIQYLDEPVDLAIPVIRHGTQPYIESFDDEKALLDTVKDQLDVLQEKNYSSIAIICKTTEECQIIRKSLESRAVKDVTILEENQESYGAGIILVPSYLAKGLEFDAVIIVALKNKYTMDSMDIKLLYVAMTRALHRLIICYKKGHILQLD
jgi:DNA helicase-2/ATP-dependent DNA helicase PcrA